MLRENIVRNKKEKSECEMIFHLNVYLNLDEWIVGMMEVEILHSIHHSTYPLFYLATLNFPLEIFSAPLVSFKK